MRGPIQCKVARGPDGVWVGIGALPVGTGALPIVETLDEASIRRRAERRIAHQYGPQIIRAYRAMKDAHEALHEAEEEAAISGEYEISGIFGDAIKFATDTFNSVVSNAKLALKAVVNSEARKKLIEKIGNGVAKAAKVIKTVYEHPIFAGIVGVISATVPGAQALGVGYALSRAAMLAAEKIAAGDPQALEAVGTLAVQAAGAAGVPGNPEAAKVLAEIAKAKAAIDAGPQAIAQYTRESAAGQAISQQLPDLGSGGYAAAGPSASFPASSYMADRAKLLGVAF